ncbi:expressed unknown protein [Seminavis robusta]|uniref:Uncharacterized protein n=1 Tax=Seminavis robusta TaxID=568900 RepID=A0A9N8DDS8_9STRA|nr:expressed unknown protein [Seminavis robusta]|eukprot:Sro26_g017830.1 n/a (905) ;mRNA; f:132453-135333
MSGSPSKQDIQPKRLELSVNQEDGSLLTAPLSTVLLASTDGLYTDLYNVAHGELDVTTAAQQGDGDEDDAAAAAPTTKKERMSNLSFAQRRHELAWRLVQHGKGLTHVAALTAANASSDFSRATQVSTRALQHARTAWVQADEAQDALYFFHAQLFPARQSPHDIYGALDVQLLGKWIDMPTDLRLTVDRFNNSQEARWSQKEVAERWQMAVRNKLLSGEIASMRRQQQHIPKKPLWNVALKGGIVRLTHGTPKRSGNQPPIYPIEAMLTVLSTSTPSEWSLLSIEARVQPKTGESNHQLEASNRQRYNLHRLAALSMAKEEARVRIAQKKDDEESSVKTSTTDGKKSEATDDATATNPSVASGPTANSLVARPLNKLFEVAHTFALSWQLEMLSAQAQALKRGNWAAGGTQPIVVTPVHFLEKNSGSLVSGVTSSNSASKEQTAIGVVSMSFWRVDDQYGPPYMGDLILADQQQETQQAPPSDNSTVQEEGNSQMIDPPVTNQLTLSIRAEPSLGIRVALSGGMPKNQAEQPHIQATLRELLDAASNPFALSASGALLAATRLCSEQKCHAIVNAIQPENEASILPSWMYLSVERTCIIVHVRVSYHGIANNSSNEEDAPMAGLFRLTCDARTGGFVCTFSRSMHLLRLVTCGDTRASESTSLRIMSLPPKRRRLAGANAVGRVARDAMDGITRSMNALGHRAGVGGAWKDRDSMSASLRQRAIQSACGDVRIALMKACGIAALYGLSALALGVATGVTVTHDMAGENLDSVDGISLLPAPPVSVLMDQQLIENESKSVDGEKKKTSYIQQQLFGVGCSSTPEALTLYPLDLSVTLDSPISAPRRVSASLAKLKPEETTEPQPISKIAKLEEGNGSSSPRPPKLQDLSAEVERFALLLTDAMD